MHTRRTGMITALLLTAALFACMPGLLRSLMPADTNRMDERLRPPRMRTLTVWLIPGQTGDEKLISQAVAAFEKARPGVRVFLRIADAQELYTPDAVLPDVALFDTGGVNMPEKAFLPLSGTGESSAMYAGVSYAVPLWLSPSVLSLPRSWLDGEARQEQAPSLLGDPPPEPQHEDRDMIPPEDIPWDRISQPGALQCPDGVALQQLLCMSPHSILLSDAVQEPYQEGCARVLPVRDHRKAVQNGQALCGCLLAPAVCDRVRYAAICRDGPDARALLSFLSVDMAQRALEAGFVPLEGAAAAADGLMRQAQELFSGVHTLPNAFAHTRSELRSLCRDSFDRRLDPVETLLKLR